MKLFLLGLFALGGLLTWWGSKISNGPGSADERIAGAFPVLAGVGFMLLSVLMSFVWLIVKV